MAIASAATIWMFLCTIPFIIIAIHSLKKYLTGKKDSKKKHVFYAFFCFSIAFILNTVAYVLVLPDMSTDRRMVITALLKLFDVINMVGIFWLFVFLTDFIKRWRKYAPFVAVHLVITLVLILAMPFAIEVDGTEYVKERSPVTSLAILFFWFLYWGVIAYQFWKHSKHMTNKVAIRRSQTMGLGGLFSVLAYVCAIFSNVFSSIILVYLALFCATVAGIVFYAGFIAPDWLRRMWKK